MTVDWQTRSLPPSAEAHREAIVLRRFEELSFQEIGQRLDRTPEAARKLFARAMSALTVEMQTAAGTNIGPAAG